MAIQQLFNSTTRDDKSAKLNTVTVTDGREVLASGVLLDNFNISVSEDWENLINVRDKFVGTQKILGALTGTSFFNAGAWTQKIFRGGGYLELSPKFRVYDKESTGESIKAVKKLLIHILPKYKGSLRTLDDLLPAARQVLKKASESVQKGINILKDDFLGTTSKIAKNVGEEIVETVTLQNGQIVENIATGITDLELIKQLSSSSPRPITIKIGEVFTQSEMLVTNLNVDFSKEFNAVGPLYVDITLNLSSLVAAESNMVNNGFSNNLSNFEVK